MARSVEIGESAGTADEQDLDQDHGDRNGRNGIDLDPFGRVVPVGDRRSHGPNRQVLRDRSRDRGRFVPASDEVTRFWAKVDKTDGCWLWDGKPNSDGYGRFRVWRDGRWTHVRAHVWAWEQVHGPVPEGHTLDHVRRRGCHHKHCVRPDHLEPVTPAVNNQRAAEWRKTNGPGRPA